jgi:hypothetical protein
MVVVEIVVVDVVSLVVVKAVAEVVVLDLPHV